jgi:threonine dehydratase
MDLASEILSTDKRIAPFVRSTPVLEVAPDDFGLTTPFRLFLKLELFQRSGSFKARGAAANLALRTIPTAGVAAASGGNHGAAVADAAALRGIPATIFVPEIAARAKIDRIAASGAKLVVAGARYADALENCARHCRATGALNIHAYDARETILGQATLGLEIDRQMRAGPGPADSVIAAVGGGGLLSGMSAYFSRSAELVAVEPKTASTYAAAKAAGGPVDIEVGGIAADSLGARRIGHRNFEILSANEVAAVQVDDDEIVEAQKALWRHCRIVAEPGGAAALAALLGGRIAPPPASRVVVVVCGGNVDGVSFG